MGRASLHLVPVEILRPPLIVVSSGLPGRGSPSSEEAATCFCVLPLLCRPAPSLPRPRRAETLRAGRFLSHLGIGIGEALPCGPRQELCSWGTADDTAGQSFSRGRDAAVNLVLQSEPQLTNLSRRGRVMPHAGARTVSRADSRIALSTSPAGLRTRPSRDRSPHLVGHGVPPGPVPPARMLGMGAWHGSAI